MRWNNRTDDKASIASLCALGVIVAAVCSTASAQTTSPAPATVTPPAARETFHIYLLLGQSNMVGRDTRTLAAQVDNPLILTLNGEGQEGEFLKPEKHPYADTVRGAIRHISSVLPHVAYANSAGFGHKGDNLHFSAESEEEFGERYARAMTTLAQPTNPPATATAAATSDLWPEGKMPGRPAHEPEQELPARGDGVQRITNVSHPTLALFPAAKKDAPAPTLIVCPGGGYSYVTYNKEGTEIAAWLNAAGISALVLKYRTPNNREGALQDLQRALSLTRAHAAEWNIDPKRLGVIGFSAGGNLAAKASTLFDQRAYTAIDAVDQQSCRPDFAVLVYPAYLEKDGQIAPDLNLKAAIPPTLIVHNEDDKSFIAGSKIYHAALNAAKAPNEFLLYPTGGHGYGLHSTKDVHVWPEEALEWLQKIGIRSAQ